MVKKTYTVAEGVDWINGAKTPSNREVELTDVEALYDEGLGRIVEKAPAKTNPQGKAKGAADDKGKGGAAR